MIKEEHRDHPFARAWLGKLTGIMNWPELDALWETLRRQGLDGWYLWQVGETPPTTVASTADVETFLTEITPLLQREHGEDYCGIVYTDDRQAPALIKIYDPNNLGVTCGFSDNPPPPGWVLSRMVPLPLEQVTPLPAGRRRWWQRLFP